MAADPAQKSCAGRSTPSIMTMTYARPPAWSFRSQSQHSPPGARFFVNLIVTVARSPAASRPPAPGVEAQGFVAEVVLEVERLGNEPPHPPRLRQALALCLREFLRRP